jgi:hypothetical protein
MDWKQKAQALKALSGMFNFTLNLRDDGSWYVLLKGVERKEGGCLTGGCQNGSTPQEAIDQCWDWATDPQFCLVKNACSPERKAYKWAGFMWKEVEEKKQ